MKKAKERSILIFLAVIIVVAQIGLVTIAEPVNQVQVNKTSMQNGTNNTNDDKPLIPEEAVHVYQKSFSKDSYIRGVYSQVSESFNVDDWNVLDITLSLDYSTTQLCNQTLSNITIAINDVRFYSQRITSTDGKKQILELKVPMDNLKKGVNTIKIEGYMRTQDSLPCVDDVSSASWMNIFKDSKIDLNYIPKPIDMTISSFYNKVTSIDALQYKESLIAISSKASNEELETAALAISGISRNAVMDYANISFKALDDDLNFDNKRNIIYISKLSTLPEIIKGSLTEDELENAKNQAVMSLVNDKEGHRILVVTSEDMDALKKAGKLIANKDLMLQLNFKTKVVSKDEDVDSRAYSVDEYINFSTQGTELKGLFKQSANFYIKYPENRMVGDGSKLYLSFRYSQNLNFDKSLVTAYINDKPVGSKKLSLDNSNGDEITFDIPTDIDAKGSLNLKISFDLEVKDAWCTLREEETPWAFISNESTLKINSKEVPYMLFESYPYPFVKDRSFNNLAIVIPDDINKSIYDVIGPLMLTLGQYIDDNRGEIKFVKASEAEKLKNYNIITIGKYSDNKFTQSLNKNLYFKFSDNGESILSNEKKVIEKEYGKTLGTAQILNSTLTKDKNGILVISGTNDDAVKSAASYLSSTEGLWGVYGDGYVNDSKNVYAYRFKEDNKKETPVVKKIGERKDLTILSIIIFMSGVMIIAVIILLVVKYRRKMDDEK
jgi:hypothetical protein